MNSYGIAQHGERGAPGFYKHEACMKRFAARHGGKERADFRPLLAVLDMVLRRVETSRHWTN